LIFLAIFNVTSFSFKPFAAAPPSDPPCPGSMKILTITKPLLDVLFFLVYFFQCLYLFHVFRTFLCFPCQIIIFVCHVKRIDTENQGYKTFFYGRWYIDSKIS